VAYKDPEKRTEYAKAYREANREKKAEYNKAYYEANREKMAEYKKAYREANREKMLERDKAYREANREKIKAYYEANREKKAEYKKAYREANREKILERDKAYREANREKIVRWIAAYKSKKYKTDPLFKLKELISGRIRRSLKKNNYTKKSRTHKILGCSFKHFKQYIENQFSENMSWENQGEWHLDHIVPVSLAINEEEILKLNYYKNFRPLWGIENIQKGNKLDTSIILEEERERLKEIIDRNT